MIPKAYPESPRRARGLVAVIGSCLALFLSCNENNVLVNTPYPGQNSPTITVAQNAFTFSVNAVALSFLSSGGLSFTGDSLVYTLSVAGYQGGTGLVKVMDEAGNTILSDSLNSSRTIDNMLVWGRIPAGYYISLENFTGRVSLALTGSQSTQVFALQDFPNTLGTSWTYGTFDSLTRQTDTAVVTVSGHTILPNTKSVTVWQTAYRSRTDSQYVSVSGDTVTVYYRSDVTVYVFPFHVGQGWKGPSGNDSNMVTQRGTISVPAGSFQNGFRIQRALSGLNVRKQSSVWLVPLIGIVDVHQTTVGFEFENTTWRLLAYHIVPPHLSRE